MSGHPAKEGDFACAQRNGFEIQREVCGQFLDALAAPLQGRCPKTQVLMHMLVIDTQEQSHLTWTATGRLQQARLEPTVEVFHRARLLRAGLRDDNGFDAQAHDPADDPVEGTSLASWASNWRPWSHASGR
ncbi:MAG TPA: hypothetical protein VJ785_07445 [Anaerolineales bacterium]|nr:hypothetical protein [Anaerolineales bacterium]